MNIYQEVGARHAQYQDGAITLSELINTLIQLGVNNGVVVLQNGYIVEKEENNG